MVTRLIYLAKTRLIFTFNVCTLKQSKKTCEYNYCRTKKMFQEKTNHADIKKNCFKKIKELTITQITF